MRILYLTNHLEPGGISSYLLNLARGLKELGCKITIASRGGRLMKDFNSLGIELKTLPLKTKSEISLGCFISYLSLSQFLKREKIDLIHANTRISQVLASLLNRKFKIPYLVTIHGYFKAKWNRKLFPCWGSKIIAISNFVKKSLIQEFSLNEKEIELIYNGIDKDFPLNDNISLRAKYNISSQTVVIASIARFSQIKGYQYLIPAFSILIKEGKDLILILAGSGREEKAIKNMIAKYEVREKTIILTDLVNAKQILSLVDIFVLPSLQEGLGISILEAMAAGKAIVATSVGGIPELIIDGENGLLVPAADIESLTNAIRHLIDNKEQRLFLGFQAQKSVEKFDYKTMAKKHYQLYKQILG